MDKMEENVFSEMKCLCVGVRINLAQGDFSLRVAMTFALLGVEEREADCDGVCEHLSHLLQAMSCVAETSHTV